MSSVVDELLLWRDALFIVLRVRELRQHQPLDTICPMLLNSFEVAIRNELDVFERFPLRAQADEVDDSMSGLLVPHQALCDLNSARL